MKRIVFLLEEDSMKVLLEELLPRLIPDLAFLCLAHEGARRMAAVLSRKNRSRSFQEFVRGVERLWTSMQAEPC